MLLYCVVIKILTCHALWKETNEPFSLEMTSHYTQGDAATAAANR